MWVKLGIKNNYTKMRGQQNKKKSVPNNSSTICHKKQLNMCLCIAVSTIARNVITKLCTNNFQSICPQYLKEAMFISLKKFSLL